MPIYEYTCEICQQSFDELVRNADDVNGIRCPHCSSEQVKRKLSVFGFISGSASGTSAARTSSCGPCSAKSCATCAVPTK